MQAEHVTLQPDAERQVVMVVRPDDRRALRIDVDDVVPLRPPVGGQHLVERVRELRPGGEGEETRLRFRHRPHRSGEHDVEIGPWRALDRGDSRRLPPRRSVRHPGQHLLVLRGERPVGARQRDQDEEGERDDPGQLVDVVILALPARGVEVLEAFPPCAAAGPPDHDAGQAHEREEEGPPAVDPGAARAHEEIGVEVVGPLQEPASIRVLAKNPKRVGIDIDLHATFPTLKAERPADARFLVEISVLQLVFRVPGLDPPHHLLKRSTLASGLDIDELRDLSALQFFLVDDDAAGQADGDEVQAQNEPAPEVQLEQGAAPPDLTRTVEKSQSSDPGWSLA
jgi:hypothetical protein